MSHESQGRPEGACAGHRPCPRHPDLGDVAWIYMRQVRPLTGTATEGEVPCCIGCLSVGKPGGTSEFAQ